MHSLHIIINPVQHAALINHHSLQLLEDVGQLDDALGNVFNLPLALSNEGFVGIMAQPLLLGLEERGLRKGSVGVRLLERGVIVGVLDRGSGAKG